MQAQADLAIANASPGGKHQKIIPDIGTWFLTWQGAFITAFHRSSSAWKVGCVVILTSQVRRQRLVVNGKDILRALFCFGCFGFVYHHYILLPS